MNDIISSIPEWFVWVLPGLFIVILGWVNFRFNEETREIEEILRRDD